jgi:hypothetical protein
MRVNVLVKKYPTGREYLEFSIHNHVIGNAEKVDGGFLVWGKRKPRATVDEAAKQMIDDHLSRLANETEKYRKMLHKLLRPKM